MNDVEEFCPANKDDWRKWLQLNHKRKDAIWLIFYKVKSPKFNLSWSDSVDEALCFGWIDSTKRSIDDERYRQYFTKRKAKSNWSKINKDKVKNLIDKGLMQEAGSKSIEIAKENGSWTLLDGVEALVIPEDLSHEFVNHKGAKAYYDGLSDSDKKMLLYWLFNAKRAATRQKRIAEIISCANRNMKPHRFF